MITPDNGSYTLYVVPDTEEVQKFARESMQDYWSQVYHLTDNPSAPGLPYLPLEFVFLKTEEELELLYADEEGGHVPVQLAVIFNDDPYQNM